MIADIIIEIERQKINLTIEYLPQYSYSSKPTEWSVRLQACNASGDSLKVERKNTDFEAAVIAAYEAIRHGMANGIQPALPAPVSDEIIF